MSWSSLTSAPIARDNLLGLGGAGLQRVSCFGSSHPLVCFTLYDSTFQLPIAFPPRHRRNVLAEVWGQLGVPNYRLAETEKYAHVTYFFNGGIEKEFPLRAASVDSVTKDRDL